MNQENKKYFLWASVALVVLLALIFGRRLANLNDGDKPAPAPEVVNTTSSAPQSTSTPPASIGRTPPNGSSGIGGSSSPFDGITGGEVAGVSSSTIPSEVVMQAARESLALLRLQLEGLSLQAQAQQSELDAASAELAAMKSQVASIQLAGSGASAQNQAVLLQSIADKTLQMQSRSSAISAQVQAQMPILKQLSDHLTTLSTLIGQLQQAQANAATPGGANISVSYS